MVFRNVKSRRNRLIGDGWPRVCCGERFRGIHRCTRVDRGCTVPSESIPKRRPVVSVRERNARRRAHGDGRQPFDLVIFRDRPSGTATAGTAYRKEPCTPLLPSMTDTGNRGRRSSRRYAMMARGNYPAVPVLRRGGGAF